MLTTWKTGLAKGEAEGGNFKSFLFTNKQSVLKATAAAFDNRSCSHISTATMVSGQWSVGRIYGQWKVCVKVAGEFDLQLHHWSSVAARTKSEKRHTPSIGVWTGHKQLSLCMCCALQDTCSHLWRADAAVSAVANTAALQNYQHSGIVWNNLHRMVS